MPCANGASCIDLVNGFMCQCSPGWSGSRCFTDIDECASNPCLEPGTDRCFNLVNSFNCTCNPGYSGVACQTEINECASNPCLNGASCTDRLAAYNCTCRAGYAGTHCQSDVNEVSVLPEDARSCSFVNLPLFVCACMVQCASAPCMHGGTCMDQPNAFLCACPAGYFGNQCQTDRDECGSVPCMNSGTCVDYVDSFLCLCRPGFTGTQCQINSTFWGSHSVRLFSLIVCRSVSLSVDECVSHPCMNGGRCIDLVNGYLCDCSRYWNGPRCGADVNECDNNSTCPSAAIGVEYCMNLIGAYACVEVVTPNATPTEDGLALIDLPGLDSQLIQTRVSLPFYGAVLTDAGRWDLKLFHFDATFIDPNSFSCLLRVDAINKLVRTRSPILLVLVHHTSLTRFRPCRAACVIIRQIKRR